MNEGPEVATLGLCPLGHFSALQAGIQLGLMCPGVSSQRPLLSILCIFARESAEDGLGWASGRKEKREE